MVKENSDIKKCITVLPMKLFLPFSILHIHNHGALCGEHTVQSPLRRAGPEALPTLSGSHSPRSVPQLRILVLALSARHSSKRSHRGRHHLLPEGQTPEEAGAEKAHGICPKGWNFILNSVPAFGG